MILAQPVVNIVMMRVRIICSVFELKIRFIFDALCLNNSLGVRIEDTWFDFTRV